MKAITEASKIVNIFLVVFCLVGCTPKNKIDESKHMCFITEKEDEVTFDFLVESRKQIVLEQVKDSYLSDIQNIALFNDKFFVLDGKKKAVLVFDNDGNYLWQIGRTGRGPGELLGPGDFAIDQHTQSVKILDSRQNKLLNYTITGGFVEEQTLDGKYASFYQFDQDTYVFEREISSVVNYAYGNHSLIDPDDKYLMAYGGTNGKIKFFPISAQRMLDGTLRYNRNCFSSFNEGVLFWQFFDNTIYYIENDRLVTKYVIDFMDRNIPGDIMEQPFHARLQLMMSPGNYEKYRGLVSDVIGHGDLIVFSYQSPAGTVFIAWDIKNDKTWRIADESLDLEHPALFKVSENQFVSVGFSDFTSEYEPQVILTLYEL